MLKKLILSGFAVALLAGFPLQALAGPNVSIYMDGQNIDFPVPPLSQNGTTMVPMRSIFESLGATISWDSLTQTVSATQDFNTNQRICR